MRKPHPPTFPNTQNIDIPNPVKEKGFTVSEKAGISPFALIRISIQ